VVLRQQREQECLDLLRKLAKRLERLEAIRMIEMLDEHRLSLGGALSSGVRSGRRWRRDLRYTLRERAVACAFARRGWRPRADIEPLREVSLKAGKFLPISQPSALSCQTES
jgi:hypothetical protein